MDNQLNKGIPHFFGIFLFPIVMSSLFICKDAIYSNYGINVPDNVCLVLILLLVIYIYGIFNVSETCKKYIKEEKRFKKTDGIIGIVITILPLVVSVTYFALTTKTK